MNALALLFPFFAVAGPPAPAPAVLDSIPAPYRVVVTGRLVDEAGAPVPDLKVTLFPAHDDAGRPITTVRTADDGTLLNPTIRTDADGAFRLEADRRFWSECGTFSVRVSRNYRSAFIRGPDGAPLTVEVAPDVSAVDLGTRTVRFGPGAAGR